MIYPVFAMRDVKAGFAQPEISLNEDCMRRTFAQRINGEGSVYVFAPGDFSLFKIGTFDTDSGQINAILPEFIVDGRDVKE